MVVVELQQSIVGHKKVKKFARALGLRVPDGIPQAVGHLCLLWLYCAREAEDGRIDGSMTREAADASGWYDSEEKFFGALKEAGFIDELDDGILRAHDWDDYTGKIIQTKAAAREKERLRKQRYRAGKKAEPGAQQMKDAEHTDTTPKTGIEPFSIDGLDENWVRVVQTYERNIGLFPMGNAADILQSYYDDLGADIVCMAIQATNNAQPNSPFPYLRAILKKWIETGVNTPEKAQAYMKDLERRIEASRQARQQKASSEPPAITGDFY